MSAGKIILTSESIERAVDLLAQIQQLSFPIDPVELGTLQANCMMGSSNLKVALAIHAQQEGSAVDAADFISTTA